VTDRKEYMKKHFIPEDVDLHFQNFLEVLAKRNELMAKNLKQILQA